MAEKQKPKNLNLSRLQNKKRKLNDRGKYFFRKSTPSVKKSVENGFKEARMMINGEIPKRSWEDFEKAILEEEQGFKIYYDVIPLKNFDKDFKKNYKKYRQALEDIREFRKELQKGYVFTNPDKKPLFEIANGAMEVYKINWKNSSANKAAKKGFRIICLVNEQDYEVYLIAMYSKADRQIMSNHEIKQILKRESFL